MESSVPRGIFFLLQKVCSPLQKVIFYYQIQGNKNNKFFGIFSYKRHLRHQNASKKAPSFEKKNLNTINVMLSRLSLFHPQMLFNGILIKIT